ncbi:MULTISPECIES: AbrB/MazE/SpoVT family DNA-binding domain-containing protein [Paenibacillus]|jgi:transcriptional pleiotropic regulator of transition state genes|uniref:Transcriptional pleiotropic regulator of transition state genes n=1 Tax=Paenibacillus silagei TaxID=1670801 RepID=A0ABS4NPU4_9BACL|nr:MULTISPECIES: AbrB/MazE/SpoVT family DNA-binding domain-containing protein [Paenibacillus]ETT79724.1 AbrB family transcriptional regulator [Paenibacillus sp. FSL R7-277]MBP2112081.1 transcriptional pleiotropic regulator of transition state genes [Paenibacillus silagei]OMF98282.1 AbrB family transcriptional regulator [Paenibacillus sp. FSL R7-0333]
MMKATGIVRKVDELGRIVIPIELRRTMGIDIKDPLEIFVDGEKIILRKYEPTCIFSGSSENLINFKGKMVSKDVLDELISSFDNV